MNSPWHQRARCRRSWPTHGLQHVRHVLVRWACGLAIDSTRERELHWLVMRQPRQK